MNDKTYWRSLHHLARSGEYQELAQNEFHPASKENDGLSRRDFIALMSASVAMASLSSCRKPVEKVIPYVIQPEEIVPGIPNCYATVMPFGLDAFGIVVETHEGRPTKIEPNSKHPSSSGSHPFIQAEILNLYDPDRSKSVLRNGTEQTWDDFLNFYKNELPRIRENSGKKLAVLTSSYHSPTLARLQADLLNVFPEAQWFVFDPVSEENRINGLSLLTGAAPDDTDSRKQARYFPVYRFDLSKVILSVDSDCFYSESGFLSAASGFARGRSILEKSSGMNRLYVVENTLSPTGAAADHRIALPSSGMLRWLIRLALALQEKGIALNGLIIPSAEAFDRQTEHQIRVIASDLAESRGQGLIVCGRHQSKEAHALAYALNIALGNVCQPRNDPRARQLTSSSNLPVKTVSLRDGGISHHRALEQLSDRINTREIEYLFILGTNPIYFRGGTFSGLLKQVKHTIHLSDRFDETSASCEWHIPQTHFLEQWGDARSLDGTAAVIQPMIEPLHGAHSVEELLHVLITGEFKRGYEIVRETWQGLLKKGNYESQWKELLRNGYLPDSAYPAESLAVQPNRLNQKLASATSAKNDGIEISVRPSTSVYDGRYANNGWLQEMPDPITKITWDNVALIGPTLAKSLGVQNHLSKGKSYQPLLKIECNDQEITIPVWVLPGHAEHSVTLSMGYGRTHAGRIGNGVGQNVYPLTTTGYILTGNIRLTVIRESHLIACVQDHGAFDEEELARKAIDKRRPVFIRESTFQRYQSDPDFAKEYRVNPALTPYIGKDGKPKSIYDSPWNYNTGYQWGMIIDLNTCIGCNACLLACQSENNIPVVGKEQVANGREMHWMRIDRYFSGTPENPQVVFQPMTCHHCENAPCEQVCPVVATVHNREGLNLMVYNRCVGTRYCANNCPYKVRRFNFLDYQGGVSGLFQSEVPEVLKMAKNPDVSVRMRGVMEKCTFCVQRIEEARQKAKSENRTIRDGELKTACQQSCPANAIHFGNILDPESQIAAIGKLPTKYALLEELNVRPRLWYLAKLRNPNPDFDHAV